MSHFESLLKYIQSHTAARIAETEARIIDKPKEDVVKGAQDALTTLIEQNKDLFAEEEEKGRKVKSRGIALCHVDQGYSANQRPVSLLTKSRMVKVEICKAGITVLTPEQEANLKGVLANLKLKGAN